MADKFLRSKAVVTKNNNEPTNKNNPRHFIGSCKSSRQELLSLRDNGPFDAVTYG